MKRTVLITGCSSGFGRQIAVFLKGKGWRVFASARKQEDVRRLAEEGFESILLDLDMSDSIHCAVKEVTERNDGTLTAVINNAGYSLIGAVEDLSRQALRQQFETNVFGAMELTTQVIPVMRRQGYGRIVMISSVNGRFSFPFMGAYCASKYALEAFSDALRRELRGTKIFVTALEPGLFRTKSVENARKIFLKYISQDQSAYTQIYRKIFENFSQATEKIPLEKSLLVAKTVWRLLESRRPPPRIMVPKASLVYEIAHRFLPDRAQDFLYALKMKYGDKIS